MRRRPAALRVVRRPAALRVVRRPAVMTIAAMAVAVAVLITACATAPTPATVTFPPSSFGPGGVGAGSGATRSEVDRVLRGIGLSGAVGQISIRPGESALFAAAQRTVLEVALPGADAVTYISIYEFSSRDAAAAAGDEQARYVTSPVGVVLFAPGTRFVMRHMGSTVVFYSWLPADEVPRTGDIAAALESIGTEIEVPS